MILTYSSTTTLTIVSDLLNLYLVDQTAYVSCTVRVYTSATAFVEETYTSSAPITGATNVYTSGGIERIKSAFLSQSVWAQGIYKVTVTLTSEAAIQVEEGCLLIDLDLACQIDDYRSLTTNTPVFLDRLMVVADYYLLQEVSECSCKCDKMFTIYDNLVLQLDNNSCASC